MAAEPRKMSFREHLFELRRRLVLCVGVFLLFCMIGYPFADYVFYGLMLPLKSTLASMDLQGKDAATLHVASLLEGIFTYLKVTIFTAIFLTAPLLLYQAWKFVMPALHPYEKNYVRTFVIGGFILFLTGMAFFYFIVLPPLIKVFLSQASADIKPVLMMEKYLSIVTTFMLIFGFAFQVPLVMLLLSLMGIVNAQGLAKSRRYAIVVIIICGAVLTPPDVISQLLMAVPLLILYEVGIWIVKLQNLLFKPRKTR